MTNNQQQIVEQYLKTLTYNEDFEFKQGKCMVQFDDEEATLQEMEGTIVSDEFADYGVIVGDTFYEGVGIMGKNRELVFVMQGAPTKIENLIHA
jgi:hypothetical protein